MSKVRITVLHVLAFLAVAIPPVSALIASPSAANVVALVAVLSGGAGLAALQSIFADVSAKAALKAGLVKPIVAGAAALMMALSLVACLTASQKQALEQEAITAGENAAACVAGQALNGQTSAEAIAISCGVSAGGPAVLQIISTLLGDLASAADAGAVGVAMAPSDRAMLVRALMAVK
jgi:hypothetical protein